MPADKQWSKFVDMVYQIIGGRQVCWEPASQAYPSCQHSDSLSSLDVSIGVITDKQCSTRRGRSQPPQSLHINGWLGLSMTEITGDDNKGGEFMHASQPKLGMLKLVAICYYAPWYGFSIEVC